MKMEELDKEVAEEMLLVQNHKSWARGAYAAVVVALSSMLGGALLSQDNKFSFVFWVIAGYALAICIINIKNAIMAGILIANSDEEIEELLEEEAQQAEED